MRTAKEVKVQIEFTPGYEQRFTAAILKLYGNRLKEKQKKDQPQEAHAG